MSGLPRPAYQSTYQASVKYLPVDAGLQSAGGFGGRRREGTYDTVDERPTRGGREGAHLCTHSCKLSNKHGGPRPAHMCSLCRLSFLGVVWELCDTCTCTCVCTWGPPCTKVGRADRSHKLYFLAPITFYSLINLPSHTTTRLLQRALAPLSDGTDRPASAKASHWPPRRRANASQLRAPPQRQDR